MLQRIEPVLVSPDDGYIAWPPMFHIGGTDSTLAAMMRGAKVLIMDGFNAEQLVAIAARARHVSATPASSDEASATAKTRRSNGQNWTPIRGQICKPIDTFGTFECGQILLLVAIKSALA
jgi:acyl-CoA synthetase (AMP-forming)/AMP-acid ligase II